MGSVKSYGLNIAKFSKNAISGKKIGILFVDRKDNPSL